MEITKVVKPFIRRGMTQYFCKYSVCVYACMYQEILKKHNKFLVCLSTLGE